MSALAFDSLKFARRLKEAGVPEQQAEAQAEVMAETFGFYVDNLVTRDYLDTRFSEQEARIETRFAEQDARIESRFAQQDLYIEQRLSRIDVKLNVMAAIQAIIAASVVPLAISTLLSN